ncbi:MAG: Asp23/Gls24 family envelope stress response protein [Clostridiales Family XIII bacterium]|jgi:uncharacterized alkaline shock family protein YloU|nr:Asp23/Gls24 family envelope stress response protein [Clostridiales Family XIII bacterium]
MLPLKNETIATDVLALYVSNAVLATEGVFDLSPLIADTITHTIWGKESRFKGIKFADGDKGVIIDIFVVLTFGQWIPDVAWNIQQNVKSALLDEMEIDIESINIHVQGVARDDV